MINLIYGFKNHDYISILNFILTIFRGFMGTFKLCMISDMLRTFKTYKKTSTRDFHNAMYSCIETSSCVCRGKLEAYTVHVVIFFFPVHRHA